MLRCGLYDAPHLVNTDTDNVFRKYSKQYNKALRDGCPNPYIYIYRSHTGNHS